ncbi:MAG: Dps family protein [bacterium]
MTDEKIKKVADGLRNVLADTYTLYMKTHGFHWNVTGPQFHTLHTMFEAQYTEMWTAMDEIAERIRALGEFAPSSGKEMANQSVIDEAEGKVPNAQQMLEALLRDHEKLVSRAKAAVELASDAEDDASEDLLITRIQSHEKTAWMLRATAG